MICDIKGQCRKNLDFSRIRLGQSKNVMATFRSLIQFFLICQNVCNFDEEWGVELSKTLNDYYLGFASKKNEK